MKLTYTSAEKTTIEVILDEGETLGNMTGPCTIFVPTDPANAEFGAILRDEPQISPFVAPQAPRETKESK